MKLSYKYRLFLWFGVIFLLFTVGMMLFEQSRARLYKTETLKSRLDAYTIVIEAQIEKGLTLDSLQNLLPQNLRITLIDNDGTVLYDNAFSDPRQLENHAGREEIVLAKARGQGSFLRKSATDHREYLYFAKSFGDHFVRVALPYDVQVRHFLRADNVFIIFSSGLFLAAMLSIGYIAGMFGRSVGRLRNFAIAAEEDSLQNYDTLFSNDELGEIGMRITANYRSLENNRKTIAQQREKLLQHIQSSEEGVCFFDPNRQVEFYNGLFMQYLNILLDETTTSPTDLFTNPIFARLSDFLLRQKEHGYFENTVTKHGKTFAVQANVFADGSFEVILRDVTRHEKTRRLKQEMTGNIAHELRTPVTSIRGYLETILHQRLPVDKQINFIAKAHAQTLALSELIRDMGLITKLDEAAESFNIGKEDMRELVEKVCEDMAAQLNERHITVNINIPAGTTVTGNGTLLYAVFRNLMDNTVKYAGESVEVVVSCYSSDASYHYFSFSDNGKGIEDEAHLNRLFERFYRIDEGRTRDAGGSGLGLSIVKNAIAFHKGSISAKKRANGGLEFLFKLAR